MKLTMENTITKIAILMYDFAIIAGTAYLVNIGWSMWTFVLTLMFFLTWD